MTAAEIAAQLAVAQANLLLISTAMARGERSVQFADRSVSYRSMDELMEAYRFWSNQVALYSGRRRQSLGYSTKGFV
jgi:hypothetical protein